jgi:POT family proton-dependent oligopeptide transporter
MMFFALLAFSIGTKKVIPNMDKAPHHPLDERERHNSVLIAIAVGIIGLFVFGGLFATGNLTQSVLQVLIPAICTAIVVTIFVSVLRNDETTKVERQRVTAYIPIFLAATVFWAIEEQQASTLAVLAEERTQAIVVFGFTVPASWYQSVNPLVIILFAPLFALLWTKLGARQPKTTTKMIIGMIITCAAFLIMAFAFVLTPADQDFNPLCIVGCLVVVSIAELMISPIGLSATTKLAPVKCASQMMALWFMADSLGQGLNGFFSRWFTDGGSAEFFFSYAGAALLLAIVLFAVRKPIKRLSNDA